MVSDIIERANPILEGVDFRTDEVVLKDGATDARWVLGTKVVLLSRKN